MRIRWKNVLLAVVIVAAASILARHWGTVSEFFNDVSGSVSRWRSDHEHFDELVVLVLVVGALVIGMRILMTRLR